MADMSTEKQTATVAQVKQSTAINRTPEIFRTTQLWMRAKASLEGKSFLGFKHSRKDQGAGLDGEGLRILSFGCADGSEMATLRCYFPSATIFGCDVNAELFRKNRSGSASGQYFHSTEDEIIANGPYDMIFAMSVLCKHPTASITEEFPFSRFVSLLDPLLITLKPGGLITIFNSSYLFSQLPASGAFRPLRSAMIPSNGWIPKWHADGTQISTVLPSSRDREVIDAEMHRKFLNVDNVSDEDLRDCIYEKREGDPIELKVGAARPAGALTVLRRAEFGVDTAQLTETAYQTRSGEIWIKRNWTVPSVNGGAKTLGDWWEKGDRASVQPGMPSVLGLRSP